MTGAASTSQQTSCRFRPPPVRPVEAPLGDIAVAFETVAREAGADGKSPEDHFTHLIVHGALHLLGFDHETEADAVAMEAAERRILATLGIGDPYANAALEESSS